MEVPLSSYILLCAGDIRHKGQSSLNSLKANQPLASHLFSVFRELLVNSIRVYVKSSRVLAPKLMVASKIEVCIPESDLSAMASSPSTPTSPEPSYTNTYPVVGEIYSVFEATMMIQAKRLVEDIAKHQGRDAKELWSQIKKQTRVKLFDTEFPEPTLCPFPIGSNGTAVFQRCRQPCLLGFGTCTEHASLTYKKDTSVNEAVDTIKDMDGNVYYLDAKSIARDRLGKPKGIVKEDVLYLFNKA